MAARPTKEIELATQRNHRKFTAPQKLEIVLAGLRGDRSVKDVCPRARDRRDALLLLARQAHRGGREQLSGKEERQGEREL